MMRRVATVLAPLLIVAVLIEVGARVDDLDTYERLLPAVLTTSHDPIFGEGEFEYATTYGLVLEAAVAAGDDATADRARAWLEADQLADGWGMSWTWDPYTDGSLTPAGTPYAVTTAIAIDGLLDGGIDDAQAERIGELLVTWAREAWTDGYFWYSLAPQDAIDTPNVSAMLAGSAARFLAGHGDVLSEADMSFLHGVVQDTFDHLAVSHDDRLRWAYSARQSTINDLGHHVYVLWGAERGRDADFAIGWSRDAAIASIDGYGSVYPPDIDLTPSMEARKGSSWQTFGTGVALAFSARWGGDVRRWSNAVCETLDLSPRVPRFDAHALLGMAFAGLCECPNRPRPAVLPIRAC
ncbi:MAG: hypothetical protein ACTS8Z_00925 [Candidatus Limnocylindrales bacterium]